MPDFLPPAKALAKKKYKFSDFNLLNQSTLDRVNKFISDNVAEAEANFVKNHNRSRTLQTPYLLSKYLRYKNPKLINWNLVENNEHLEHIWVLPIFLQPGKADFVIRSEKQESKDDYEVFCSRHLIEIREERVPFCKCFSWEF